MLQNLVNQLLKMNPDFAVVRVEFDYVKYAKPEVHSYSQGLFGKAENAFRKKASGDIKDAIWCGSASIEMAERLKEAALEAGCNKVLLITKDTKGDYDSDLFSDLETAAKDFDVIISLRSWPAQKALPFPRIITVFISFFLDIISLYNFLPTLPNPIFPIPIFFIKSLTELLLFILI